jgi:tripartite-type tricarboxylate transporter receptor subunit TctC
MGKRMKLLIAFVLGILAATQVLADISIGAGKPGGGYDSYAQSLATRVAQRQIAATVVNYNGSDEISLALCSNNVQVAPVQIDAIYARAAEGCELKPIGVYEGEYAVMMVPPKSPINELEDLTENSVVMVDTIGSGSELFANTIKSIELGDEGSKNKWAKFQVNNDPVELAHAAAGIGDVDALILVRRLHSDSGLTEIRSLLRLGWTFAELYDKDLNDVSFNGKPLYEGDYFVVKDEGRNYKSYGYVVRTFVVANKELQKDKKTFAEIVKAVNRN